MVGVVDKSGRTETQPDNRVSQSQAAGSLRSSGPGFHVINAVCFFPHLHSYSSMPSGLQLSPSCTWLETLKLAASKLTLSYFISIKGEGVGYNWILVGNMLGRFPLAQVDPLSGPGQGIGSPRLQWMVQREELSSRRRKKDMLVTLNHPFYFFCGNRNIFYVSIHWRKTFHKEWQKGFNQHLNATVFTIVLDKKGL